MSKELIDAVVDMREDDAIKIAEKLLETGAEPLGLLDDCREALGIIGNRFAAGECFVPELILAGEMLRQIGAMVKPRISGSGAAAQKKLGKIVFGTVEGDIHDIAKDIVVFMLDVNGFRCVHARRQRLRRDGSRRGCSGSQVCRSRKELQTPGRRTQWIPHTCLRSDEKHRSGSGGCRPARQRQGDDWRRTDG